MDPYGYTSTSTSIPVISSQKNSSLKLNQAWDIAIAPIKSLPMNCLMLYMSGNSIQIFSILITAMLIFNNMKAMFNVQKAIKVNELKVKIVYVLGHALVFGLGLYKCSAMGLLPTSSSDWLAFIQQKEVLSLHHSCIMNYVR